MKRSVMDKCLWLLVELRDSPVCSLQAVGCCDGYFDALFDSSVVTFEEYQRLQRLNACAFSYSGRPFLNARNVGPLMPPFIANQRNRESSHGRACQ